MQSSVQPRTRSTDLTNSLIRPPRVSTVGGRRRVVLYERLQEREQSSLGTAARGARAPKPRAWYMQVTCSVTGLALRDGKACFMRLTAALSSYTRHRTPLAAY